MLNAIFQFIAATDPSVEKTLSGPLLPNTSVIFDLEDSLQNIFSPKETPHLKANGRRNILDQLQSPVSELKNKNLGVRINSFRSREFENDIRSLSEANKKINWKYIFLPKTEYKNDIEFYLKRFHEHSISFDELIPIIETVKGLDNIKNIFSDPPEKHFNKAILGHHDYNLDAGNWPFYDQRSKEYWTLTKRFIKHLENNGYGYINGPVLKINDDTFLKNIVSATKMLCTRSFSQATISFRQVKTLTTLHTIAPIPYSSIVATSKLKRSDKTQMAKKVIGEFKKYQLKGKGFSVDTTRQLFISPQQYMAAINYLKKAND